MLLGFSVVFVRYEGATGMFGFVSEAFPRDIQELKKLIAKGKTVRFILDRKIFAEYRQDWVGLLTVEEQLEFIEIHLRATKKEPAFDGPLRTVAETSCFPTVLRRLRNEPKLRLSYPTTANRYVPVSELKELADSNDNGVRQGVAINPNTPVPVLEKIFNVWGADSDSCASCCSSLASNPNTPVRILKQIALSDEFLIELAENPSTPAVILERIAADETARKFLTLNPSTPLAVLRKLASDPDASVRLNLAYSNHTPPEILAILAIDSESKVRARVSENPNTPPSVLMALAKDRGFDLNLARNPSTPSSLLEELVHRHIHWTQAKVEIARNPNAPVSLVEALRGESEVSEALDNGAYDYDGGDFGYEGGGGFDGGGFFS